MVRGDRGLYGRSFAAVYDDWYHDLDDPHEIVAAFQSRCAADARILELGAGTGRLALPLSSAGFVVTALDISMTMLQQGRTARSVVADMAKPPICDTSVDAVLIAYNTLLNLESRPTQQDCLHEVARMLIPGGVVAIENFHGAIDRDTDVGLSVRAHPSRDGLIAILTHHVETNDGDISIVGTHVELTPHATITRPWRLCYLDPEDLDAHATKAGLELIERSRDWTGSPFDHDSERHISWYRRSTNITSPIGRDRTVRPTL